MNIIRPAITITLFALLPLLCFAQPTITSLSPNSGDIGSSVSIYGNGFSDISDENTVFFGGMEAMTLNATENELTVSVPHGAYNDPVYVYTNGLYTASSERFNVIFDAEEELTVEHLANQLYNPYLGKKYYDIKIADMNGDNVAEIVTSEAGSGSSAYLAIFTTSFDDEGTISIDQHIELNFGTGVYSAPQDIALGDLNGDGLLDVVTSEQGDVTDDFEAHTCIFINSSENQNFSFESPIIIDGDGYENSVQLHDINGDGKLDIVTTLGDQLGIYVNTSDENSVSFADKIIISNVFANGRPDFADLNGDGMIDMVTTPASSSSYTNREVFVYSNNSAEGNIEFDLEVTILSGGEPADWPTDYHWSASNPTLSDIDGNGRLDIVVTNGTCNGCSPSGISILRNTSTDSEIGFEYEYSDYYQYESNSQPVGISISDLNGDGKPDILTNDWMGGISIIINSSTEGNISLDEQMIIGVGGFPLSIATADLNMDFTPEIVVANWEVEGLRIIHNFIPSTRPISSSISNITENKSNLVKITDVSGREIKETKNQVLFYIYDDGTVEKKIILE